MDNSNNNENIEDKGKGREDKIASIVHNKTKDTYEGSIDKNTVDIWVKTVVTALGNEGQLKKNNTKSYGLYAAMVSKSLKRWQGEKFTETNNK